ncbi:MAG: ATP synthase F0 subunit B [Candidatus Sericytochromatia bacterium]|nr:ATP synthase F0 subunit B [Candidatus Sericytochromatia bacterium]
MIEFDATLIVQMINFAVFLFILRKILFKPLVNHIQARRNYLSSSEKKINEGLTKLESAEKEYQSQLDDARKKAQEIISKNVDIAEAEKQTIIKAAVDETKKVFDDFRAELDQEISKAKMQLQAEVDTLAEEISTKILATKSDDRVLIQGGSR